MTENLFPPLPDKKYSIIYCDPPWDYKGQEQFGDRGIYSSTHSSAKNEYPTVPTEKLKKLNVASIAADDCLLWMWTSNPHLDQAISLGEAWGFKYITIGFVWDKKQPVAGFYTMSQIEICLIFKKGKIPSPRGSRGVKQFFSGYKKKEEHSVKPLEFRWRIMDMFPTQEKIELFSRTKCNGWDMWGNDDNISEEEHGFLTYF